MTHTPVADLWWLGINFSISILPVAETHDHSLPWYVSHDMISIYLMYVLRQSSNDYIATGANFDFSIYVEARYWTKMFLPLFRVQYLYVMFNFWCCSIIVLLFVWTIRWWCLIPNWNTVSLSVSQLCSPTSHHSNLSCCILSCSISVVIVLSSWSRSSPLLGIQGYIKLNNVVIKSSSASTLLWNIADSNIVTVIASLYRLGHQIILISCRSSALLRLFIISWNYYRTCFESVCMTSIEHNKRVIYLSNQI